MGRLSMNSKCLDFFSPFKFWVGEKGGRGRIFFIFPFCSQYVPFKFPVNSHQVPNTFPRFSMCSPRVFPITPCFNPICSAQSPPLLTYIGGPKGKALHLFIESSILGSLHSFNFFWRWASQIGSLQPKEKVGLARHPQLINMKQNKYTQFISPSWKWWSTVLQIETSCSQWQSSACSRGLSF